MRRRIILALFLSQTVSLFAHDEFRVIGVVVKKQGNTMQVRNKDGKVISIGLTRGTVVTRDKKNLGVSEVQTGLTVVVDALGDSEADLEAVEVRIVPPIAPSK